MVTAATIEPHDAHVKRLAKNLRMLFQKRGVTESEVAHSLNIPVMTVRRLVSGETTDPRISTLKLIAGYFDVTVDALTDKHDFKTMAHMSHAKPQFIPVLDWKTAAHPVNLASCQHWCPIITSNQPMLSDLAFALESRPSMQPRFPMGTLFIIDPNETPTDGDVVLVKMTANGELSLRELVIDSPHWQLQPIIAGSGTLLYDQAEHSIVGVVMLTMFHTRKNKI